LRLTDPFYQADSALNRNHEGMGLGLYLVKKYVELLAGDLTLESEKNAFFKARIELPATCLARYRDAARNSSHNDTVMSAWVRSGQLGRRAEMSGFAVSCHSPEA
jgi:hypothetical protein